MRTLVVVGRLASPTSDGAIPASRQACASVAAPSSWPVTATTDAWPPSAATLFATFADPPMRYISWSKATTGTGASGEMRVTRPTMNLSSIASPTTRTWAPANAAVIRRARSGAIGGSSIGGSGERQGHQHQEQHQKLGIAEIVFKQARAQHRDN